MSNVRLGGIYNFLLQVTEKRFEPCSSRPKSTHMPTMLDPWGEVLNRSPKLRVQAAHGLCGRSFVCLAILFSPCSRWDKGKPLFSIHQQLGTVLGTLLTWSTLTFATLPSGRWVQRDGEDCSQSGALLFIHVCNKNRNGINHGDLLSQSRRWSWEWSGEFESQT